jgi:hypothetical protein
VSGISLKLVTSVSHTPLSKCAKIILRHKNLRSCNEFCKEVAYFFRLNIIILYINVTEQWPLHMKNNFAMLLSAVSHFSRLYTTILYINVTEQWLLYMKNYSATLLSETALHMTLQPYEHVRSV